jgi:hypothetical protein
MDGLTKAQRCALEWMENNSESFDGMAAANGSQLRMLVKMKSAGLVKFVGYGTYDAGNPDREYPIFAITDAGLAAIDKEHP